MKKFYAAFSCLSLLAIFVVFIQGCLKDTVEGEQRYTIYTPIFKTLQEVRSEVALSAPITVGYPGKIYIKGDYLFVTEIGRGIHVFDNINPSSPNNIGFIKVPSNMDVAVKNNALYADMYKDLITIDITDPKNAKLKTVTEDVFTDKYIWYLNKDKVIAGYEKRDTVVYSTKDAVPKPGERWIEFDNVSQSFGTASTDGGFFAAPTVYGTGGSMARFAALQDRLYTVGNTSLGVFNIADDYNPSFVTRKNLGWGIETIFPFKNNLFVGTTTGVKILSLSNPDNPAELATYEHFRRCDPVVANDNYAFSTLRAGVACGGNPIESSLHILSIENITNPKLVKSYNMENPYGVGLDGNTLFVCDGTAGLKVYDASDVTNLKLLNTIKNIEPTDIIAINGLAIVVDKNAIYQYDYKNINNIKLLSTTKLNK